MRPLLHSFIILAACFGMLSPAHAASLKEARSAFNSGQYDHAVSMASTLGTSQSLALGSEALNAKLLLGTGGKKIAKRSMKLAQAALAKDPKNKDAQMQYTVAYGYYGRSVSDFTAFRKKLPQKTHAQILINIDVNAQHPYAHALMGAWHLSIIGRGGAKRGKKMFGADIKTGRRYFDYAVMEAPNDIVLNANYACMFYALDPKANKQWAKEKFLKITKARAVTSLEHAIQSRMRSILSALETDENKAHELARKFAFE